MFMDPTTLPSVRYSAGKYLTHFDFSGAKVMTADNKEDKQRSLQNEVLRSRMFVGVALLLDKEVVGWYEAEIDKTRMQGSMMGGASGMMGGGMMGGGMMGGGGAMGGDDGYSGMMGGGGMGGGTYGGGEPGMSGRGETMVRNPLRPNLGPPPKPPAS